MKRFWIRVDASYEIGTGHVYRCVQIAKTLQQDGYDVIFICRAFDGNLIDWIKSQSFCVLTLPSELPTKNQLQSEEPVLKHGYWLHASQLDDLLVTYKSMIGHLDISDKHVSYVVKNEWMLIDHFGLDYRWHSAMKVKTGVNIAVIDGQADRKHDTDILIDPNECNKVTKWQGLISDQCKLFQGYSYIPLSPEFNNCTKPRKRKELNHILISFGGVDSDDYTLKALNVLKSFNFRITIAVGKNYKNIEHIRKIVESSSRMNLYVQTNKMAELMLQADLAIGAGGTMIWERCKTALPSLITVIADNQLKQVDCVEELGIGKKLNPENFELQLKEQIINLQKNSSELMEMSSKEIDLNKKRTSLKWSSVFKR
ncbi:UDP-2,4-diacetamido-2,4,6-trideoxy-beta-L-altropyranose hydrolase [Thiomicrorhabdus sp. Milos-T2]|uniref:UDP-2,4-diacetamido-2,4, 6-trideoxy-beta-L-altropyranose hydrolase n=1 Tax=Thiomicrorhabdus sp. Milos-T2 TaxID=90814 RepID=UPI000494A3B7|nr:UDP-2,4-diacetamido-2,4,6-trideoxy-beta-L-altropyranose hydrolase [Thiomicrorhabdus sp. Milos-T2]